jgi:hypothetical protein
MYTALAVAAFPAGIVPNSQRSFVGKVASQLCGDRRDPKEVPVCMHAGRQRFESFTIAGLPKWWDELSKNGKDNTALIERMRARERSAR